MKNTKSDQITTKGLMKIRNGSIILFIIAGVLFITGLYDSGILLLLICGCILALNYIITKRWYREVIEYSEVLEHNIEKIILEEKMPEFNRYQDSILSRNQTQLNRLCEVLDRRIKENRKEKVLLQTLVSDMAHQVKTPIASVVLYISALRKPDLSLGKKEYYLNVVSEQISRLDFLMNNLLKMSRLETGIFTLAPQILPIQDTLASALGSVAIKAEEKNIIIQVDCSEELTALHDRKWTSEALENVLENAVKYTPVNGCIDIKVVHYEVYTLIEISDTGIGIIPEEIPRIFKRFYRGKNVQNDAGVGIGLYLVREILSMEKGFITVASAEGKGSKFSIYLANK